MLWTLLIASALVAITVGVHAVGFALILSSLVRLSSNVPVRTWAITWLLVRLAWSLMLLHVLEISIWALFYLWYDCMPDAESAFYFSGVTYSTIGYGDLVLPPRWRLLGPIEGLTGILLCGLSAGLFFAIVNRIHIARSTAAPEAKP